jgi:hypothetical protein
MSAAPALAAHRRPDVSYNDMLALKADWEIAGVASRTVGGDVIIFAPMVG